MISGAADCQKRVRIESGSLCGRQTRPRRHYSWYIYSRKNITLLTCYGGLGCMAFTSLMQPQVRCVREGGRRSAWDGRRPSLTMRDCLDPALLIESVAGEPVVEASECWCSVSARGNGGGDDAASSHAGLALSVLSMTRRAPSPKLPPSTPHVCANGDGPRLPPCTRSCMRDGDASAIEYVAPRDIALSEEGVAGRRCAALPSAAAVPSRGATSERCARSAARIPRAELGRQTGISPTLAAACSICRDSWRESESRVPPSVSASLEKAVGVRMPNTAGRASLRAQASPVGLPRAGAAFAGDNRNGGAVAACAPTRSVVSAARACIGARSLAEPVSVVSAHASPPIM